MASIIAEQMRARFQQLSEEDKTQVRSLLTPELANLMGKLLGAEVGEFVASRANPANVLKSVPRQAIEFMGTEKFDNFVAKAMENAQLQSEQKAQVAVEKRRGLAAPAQQAQQQAPVSPPAPTGFSSRPQLPLPDSSNATSVGNQPIQ